MYHFVDLYSTRIKVNNIYTTSHHSSIMSTGDRTSVHGHRSLDRSDLDVVIIAHSRYQECLLSSLPPSSAASPPSRRPRSKCVKYDDESFFFYFFQFFFQCVVRVARSRGGGNTHHATAGMDGYDKTRVIHPSSWCCRRRID